MGKSSVLVIAPHGGLSREDLLTASAAGRRGNDLHTADLARELAGRLGASSLVNTACDRNELDLNRVSEVTSRATWFLDSIEGHLERILARHEVAHLLFVHGWHVGQARCDLGIGASLERASGAAAIPASLTVSPGFAVGRLEAFRRRLEGLGVLATYGERWPAAHRNNVMRLFRRRPVDDPPSAAIRGWVDGGRIEAVQLELGAPVRWPGRVRSSFVDAATLLACDADGTPASDDTPSEAVPDAVAPPGAPTAMSLQAFDPDSGSSGLGVVMGAMHLPGGDVGARLQLFPGGQRMGIFTGHGLVGPVLGVPDLWFEPAAGGFVARFDGRLLVSPDAGTYFRDERAQAAADLRDTRVELAFREQAGGFGALRGCVTLGGERHEVRTSAFADVRMAVGRGGGFGTRLLVSLDGAPPLRVEAGSSEPLLSLARLGASGWEQSDCEGAIEDESGESLVVRVDGHVSLRARVRTRATLLRPVGPRRWIRATFGLVHVHLADGLRGSGFFEQRRPV